MIWPLPSPAGACFRVKAKAGTHRPCFTNEYFRLWVQGGRERRPTHRHGTHLHHAQLGQLFDKEQAFRHIFQRSLVVEEVVVLKDHRCLAAQRADVALAGLFSMNGRPVDGDGAGVRRIQPVHGPQKRGLSGAGGADHRDDLAFADLQIHPAKHMVVAKGFAKTLYRGRR